ncbi:MAG: hypothetical protein ABIK67_02770, partial [candidate division WOR-3 bacterium]
MVNLFTALLIFLIQGTIEMKGGNGIFYRVFIDQRRLCFQYKIGRNWSEATVLDTGDVSSPSIAITPKDLLHIVWQKNEGGRSRIYYITTLEGITPDYIRGDGEPHWSE